MRKTLGVEELFSNKQTMVLLSRAIFEGDDVCLIA